MKIQTKELTGAALDWAVAKCEGVNEEAFHLYYEPTEPADYDSHGYPEFHYSTVWAQGGLIIEREEIDVVFRPGDKLPGFWDAYSKYAYSGFPSPTPLISAKRCYVASKLGDVVEVPDEIA